MSDTMRLYVNGVEVEWESRENAPLRMCQGCRQQTRGKATMHTAKKTYVNTPWCLNCVIAHAFINAPESVTL